jgi:hypothetical protein
MRTERAEHIADLITDIRRMLNAAGPALGINQEERRRRTRSFIRRQRRTHCFITTKYYGRYPFFRMQVP